MKSGWIRRRWLDFRLGHSTYLIFLMAFGNFVLIFHRLLIERVEFLNKVFSELWFFIVIFVAIYFPLAVLIGAWHRKTQIRVENQLTLYQNPVLAEWFRTMIDIQTGKASQDEIERIRKILKEIEGGKS